MPRRRHDRARRRPSPARAPRRRSERRPSRRRWNSTTDSWGSSSSVKPSRRSTSAAKRAGDGERRLDGLGVGVGAVRRQAEPQRQAAGPAGEVEGEVARVPLVAARPCRGSRRAGRGRRRPAAGSRYTSAAQSYGREQPLVRVDAEAVGPLEAAPRVGRRRRAQRGTAVGGVDVQPQRRARRRRRRSRRARRSAPAFVVPKLATTANSAVAARLRRASARSASPVIRPRSSGGTSTTSTSITPAAACTEAWVSPVVAKRQRPPVGVGPAAGGRGGGP